MNTWIIFFGTIFTVIAVASFLPDYVGYLIGLLAVGSFSFIAMYRIGTPLLLRFLSLEAKDSDPSDASKVECNRNDKRSIFSYSAIKGFSTYFLSALVDDEAFTKKIIEDNGLPPLVKVLESTKDEKTQEYCLKIFASVARTNDANRLLLVSAGALPPIISCLTSPPLSDAGKESVVANVTAKNGLIQEYSAVCLMEMMKNGIADAELLSEVAVMKALVEVSLHGTDKGKEAVSALIINLVSASSNHQSMIDIGLAKSLILSLKNGSDTIKSCSSFSIAILVLSDQEKRSLFEEALPFLVDQLQKGNVVGVKNAALAISLFCSDAKYKETLLNMNVVEKLVSLLKSTEQTHLELTALALFHLFLNYVPAVTVGSKIGAVNELHRVIASDSVTSRAKENVVRALGALANVPLNSEATLSVFATIREEIASAGLIRDLIGLLESPLPSLRIHVMDTLTVLTSSPAAEVANLNDKESKSSNKTSLKNRKTGKLVEPEEQDGVSESHSSGYCSKKICDQVINLLSALRESESALKSLRRSRALNSPESVVEVRYATRLLDAVEASE